MLIHADGPLNIDSFDRRISDRRPGSLVIDLDAASFVDMYALIGITTSAVRARAVGRSVSFIPPRRASVANYLARMGLPAALHDHGIASHLPDVRSNPLPESLVSLHGFRDDTGLTKLSNLLRCRLSSQPALMQHLEPLVGALWELGTNVNEHAQSSGFAVAQVYNKAGRSKRVDLVIGDAGVGIRRSFLDRGSHEPTDDIRAIDLALKYLVSSVDDEGRGQGLTTTVEEALACKGKAVIRTGSGCVVRRPRGRRALDVPFLHGTTVLVSIPCV